MLRPLALGVAFVLAPLAAPAQDRAQTLADIRQEMSVLYVEIQRLRRELSTTGAPNPNLSGTTALERIDSIEAALSRLTARTEELGNRIDRIVSDGTNRLGDLEFRLVELEGGDVSTLGETSTLGGGPAPSAALTAPAPDTSTGPELAIGEQRDFDAAKAAYDAGSYETAASQFETFAATYLGGPLTAEAHFWRGKSLAAMGNVSGAARAYLEAYSGDPEGMLAPDSLLELGLALGRLGETAEACKTLTAVGEHFSGSAAADEAVAARTDLGCS